VVLINSFVFKEIFTSKVEIWKFKISNFYLANH